MNITAFSLGIALSIVIIVFFKHEDMFNRGKPYAYLLFTFPFYYFLFALWGKDLQIIPLEMLAGIPFFIITFIALKFAIKARLQLLALGFVLHGLYDVIHVWIFTNIGTPLWWPEFCGVIDLILGGYLFYTSLNQPTLLIGKSN